MVWRRAFGDALEGTFHASVVFSTKHYYPRGSDWLAREKKRLEQDRAAMERRLFTETAALKKDLLVADARAVDLERKYAALLAEPLWKTIFRKLRRK